MSQPSHQSSAAGRFHCSRSGRALDAIVYIFPPMVDERAWSGLLRGRRGTSDVRRLVAPIGDRPGEGGSAPLQMLDADGAQWWVKLENNRQSPMVLVNEQVVARCGALIGALTCDVAIVEVTEALAGDIHGIQVEPGLAHGSRHVQGAINERRLRHRTLDDNARRHVGVYALHDWCWGNDSQWLYALEDNHKTYSHDHGHFFPSGPDWNQDLDQVMARVDVPHELHTEFRGAETAGLDAAEIRQMSERLSLVRSHQLVEILAAIPEEWPVSDNELECLGFFLERRAPQVAQRLLNLAGGA